ncbi:hypothetical protein P0W64_13795 [Tsukamurella sp. 8F]|uniref:hypothetical protein n=1 Tax=unclassified Tsukamurella TaxID=2633480 RepID=UPI0023B8BBE0|nr:MULTISPECIES: hypothetical protein [unclassified Tsukamurella]MDF0530645.1 hypothetical protein [Tsukamurella sp. 8J]MDF0587846.1 hypothetical protein [Tsukamurella sp. 8F]
MEHAVEDESRRRFLRSAGLGLGTAAGLSVVASCSPDPVATPVDLRARAVLADLSSSSSADDNSARITAALEQGARSGAEVVVPGGVFDHSGFTLPNDGQVSMRGMGRSATRLRNRSVAASITAHGKPGGPYCPGWSISGLTLDAATDARTVGLDVALSTRFSARDIDIRGHGVGVAHMSSWACQYSDVSVFDCETGWRFPTTRFTPSSPVTLTNCNSFDNETAVQVDDAVESLLWDGGDWSGCTNGIRILGNEVRTVRFGGINFERIKNEDVVVGTDTTGPAGVTFSACRFFRTTPGKVSIRYERGEGLNLTGCRWTNYSTAVEQQDSAGTLLMSGNSTSRVRGLLDRAGQTIDEGAFVSSAGNDLAQVSLTGTSLFHSVSASEGVQTKFVSGPGRTTVSDADFRTRPAPGWTAVVENTDDGTLRHAVRGSKGWRTSAAYT